MSLAAIMGGIAQVMLPVLFREGDDQKAVQDKPPRVVWYPVADTYGGARLQGATQPRPVGTRVAGVEFRVWGEDLEKTEALVNTLVASIYAETFGSSKITGGHFQAKELNAKGRLYVLNATFDIPVTMPPLQTVTIASETQDVAFQDS